MSSSNGFSKTGKKSPGFEPLAATYSDRLSNMRDADLRHKELMQQNKQLRQQHKLKIEEEKQKIEQRTEQIVKERKAKAKDYLVQKVGEANLQKHKENTEKKAQLTIPCDDKLYLNHDFEEREDFEQYGAKNIALAILDPHYDSKPKTKKAFHHQPNYDHVQSVITSHKSKSDIGSNHGKSHASEMNHDGSSMPDPGQTTQSSTSLASTEKSRKLDRRKSIEAKYLNPMEREFMEMMENDIDDLASIPLAETLSKKDIPESYGKIQWAPLPDQLIWKQQVNKIQQEFTREYENRLNDTFKEQYEADTEELEQNFIRKGKSRSPPRFRYTNRSPSPENKMYKEHQNSTQAKNPSSINQNNKASQHQQVHSQPSIQPSSKAYHEPMVKSRAAAAHMKYMNQDIVVQENRNPQSHNNSRPSNQLAKSSEIQIMNANVPMVAHQPSSDKSKPKQQELVSSHQANPHQNVHNQTRNTNFLKENKYTIRNNNAINEESSDNPFDKFDKFHQQNPHEGTLGQTESNIKTGMLLNSGNQRYMMTTGTFNSNEESHDPASKPPTRGNHINGPKGLKKVVGHEVAPQFVKAKAQPRPAENFVAVEAQAGVQARVGSIPKSQLQAIQNMQREQQADQVNGEIPQAKVASRYSTNTSETSLQEVKTRQGVLKVATNSNLKALFTG